MRLRQVADALPRTDRFGVIEAIPIPNTGGRLQGLYRVGSPGSTGGVFVYDPANGPPQLPSDISIQCDLFIACELTAFEPGVDYFEWGI